ncbi:MAG: hypothetical protein ACI8R6_000086 [Candidatus Paceibacteria bacterium]
MPEPHDPHSIILVNANSFDPQEKSCSVRSRIGETNDSGGGGFTF